MNDFELEDIKNLQQRKNVLYIKSHQGICAKPGKYASIISINSSTSKLSSSSMPSASNKLMSSAIPAT